MSTALLALGSVILGAVLTWWTQRSLANAQLTHQLRRDSIERLAALRRPFVDSTQSLLAGLIALTLKEIPARQRDPAELMEQIANWLATSRQTRQNEDSIREELNKLALMSPSSATLDHIHLVLDRLDSYEQTGNSAVSFLDTQRDDFTPDESDKWLADFDALNRKLKAQHQELLEAVFQCRRHLELLVSDPEQPPNPPISS